MLDYIPGCDIVTNFSSKLESVGPTFSSLESKMAPSQKGKHGGKRDNSGPEKAPG